MRRSKDEVTRYKDCINLAEVPLEFVKEWHKKLNLKSPKYYKPQSNQVVWWTCKFGHEWETSIQRRFLGDNCPFCNHKKPTSLTSLSSQNPLLASEWNYHKNKNLTPDIVLPKSSKTVWWICSSGHEWEARIDNRSNGSRCPVCKKFKNSK